jgi:hypothetical protein
MKQVISSELRDDLGVNEYHFTSSFFQGLSNFAAFESTANPGANFEVPSQVLVTISKSQF